MAGHFHAETSQENGKRLASGHLGRTNEQLQRAQKLAERYNKKTMENATGLPWDQRPPRDHADGGPFEGREPPQGTPGQSDEQLADRRQGAELAQFHASCGQTPGCQAWLGIRRGFHHTWPAKQDSKSGKTDGNQKKRKHRDRDHRTNAGVVCQQCCDPLLQL